MSMPVIISGPPSACHPSCARAACLSHPCRGARDRHPFSTGIHACAWKGCRLCTPCCACMALQPLTSLQTTAMRWRSGLQTAVSLFQEVGYPFSCKQAKEMLPDWGLALAFHHSWRSVGAMASSRRPPAHSTIWLLM